MLITCASVGVEAYDSKIVNLSCLDRVEKNR